MHEARTNTCQALYHPAYGEHRHIRSESNVSHRTSLSLAALCESAKDCGFCAILYQGIDSYRVRWIPQWAFCRWREAHCECDLDAAIEQEDWFDHHATEIEKSTLREYHPLAHTIFSTKPDCRYPDDDGGARCTIVKGHNDS